MGGQSRLQQVEKASLRCLLCEVLLQPTERWEHPILKALGGRLQSRELLCNECNGRLGVEIDGPLAVALEPLRYTLCVRSGGGAPPPTLRRIDSELGVIDLGPGLMELSKVRPELVQTAGEVEVKVNARTMAEAALQTAHMARKAGIASRDELAKRLRLPADLVVRNRPLTKPVTLKMSLGSPEQMRSIAKSALEIFALAFPDRARGPKLAKVRQYVAKGISFENRVCWFFNNLPPLPFSDDELGTFPHSVLVWGHKGSPLAANVNLFGHLPLLVRLADEWTESVCVAHAVNPIDERSLPLLQCDVPPAVASTLFNDEVPDPDELNKRISTFIVKASGEGRKRHLKYLVDRAIDPLREVLEDLPFEEMLQRVADAAAKSYADATIGSTDPIDVDHFKELVLQTFDRLAMKEGKAGSDHTS
jgi:hypothetical protein